MFKINKNTSIILLTSIITIVLIIKPAHSVFNNESAPAIIMRFIDGKSYPLLESCRQETVILSFFNHGCRPCLEEIPFLQGMKNKYKKTNIILVAGHTTDAQKASEFIRIISRKSSLKIELPIALDRFGDIEDIFHIKAHPTTIIINNKCKIQARFDGYKKENEKTIEEILKLSK